MTLVARIALSSSLLIAAACGDLSDIPGSPGGGSDDEPGNNPELRVTEGLEALYLFDERTGALVQDNSGHDDPIDLIIENPTSTAWIDTGGLEIIIPGTRLSSGAPATRVIDACMESNAIAIEAWIRPSAVQQTAPILSLASAPDSRNFALVQSGPLADARVRTSGTDNDGQPAVVTEQTAFTGQVVHLVYTRSGIDDIADLWVDGQLYESETLGGSFLNWDITAQLAIANDVAGDTPWRGGLYLAAVYCRDLTPGDIWQNYTAGF